MSTKRISDIEARAVAAEKRVTDISHGRLASLEAAISAAELYMQALRLTEKPAEKRRLDAKAKELILKAENIKKASDGKVDSVRPSNRSRIQHPVSSRELTTREKIILLEGSKLNGAVFKPWTTVPSIEEFALKDGEELWTDDFEYTLCETQLKHFNGWDRPNVALSQVGVGGHVQSPLNEITMGRLGICDLVQDAAPDCSVVASFCVGTARAEKGHRKASSLVFRGACSPDHLAGASDRSVSIRSAARSSTCFAQWSLYFTLLL